MNKVFKALNDPNRRQIIELLKKGTMNAGEIAACFDMSKPSVSHHLDVLSQAGLIEGERKGQFIDYSLNTSVLDELISWFISIKK